MKILSFNSDDLFYSVPSLASLGDVVSDSDNKSKPGLICRYEIKRVANVVNKRSHSMAVSAHDCIVTRTLRPNERLQVLSSFKVDQADNMDPLPQFSRSVRRGRQRYEAAEKAAQNAAKESAATTQNE